MAVNFLFSVERGDGIAICGKSRPPARAAQLGIAHTFVGPAAFAVKVRLSLAWQRTVKVIGKPPVNLGLRNRCAIAHIVDSRCRRLGEQMDDGSRCVVPVDLIDPAQAIPLDHGLARKKFPHDHGATRTIKSREPRDEPAGIQRNSLGLEQHPPGFTIRFGFAGLVHPRSIDLRIDGGAACDEHLLRFNAGQRIHQSANIHGTIRLRDGTVWAGAVDKCVSAAPGGDKRKSPCDIQRTDFVGFADEARGGFRTCAEPKYVPAAFGKQIGCGLTEETAAGYYNPWQRP